MDAYEQERTDREILGKIETQKEWAESRRQAWALDGAEPPEDEGVVTATPSVQRGTGRPKGGYKDADGNKVPSVTEITGRFKESGRLIGAANKVGREGLTLHEAWYGAQTIGKYAHSLIEAELNFKDQPEVPEELKPEDLAKSLRAFTAWSKWFNGIKAEIIATELPLFASYGFAGTIDCVIRDRDGDLCIADWKAASGLFLDNLLQLAGYGLLWNDTQPEKITGGFHLVRIGKDDGSFHHHHWPELDDAAEMFLTLVEAWKWDVIVSKQVPKG